MSDQEPEKPKPIDQQLQELKEAIVEMRTQLLETIHKRFDEIKKILTSEEW